MERKLASIQKVREVLPIEGADAIEVVVINNWKVVVKKDDNYKPGDLIVYCEIDSFLPIREEFEFLRGSSYKKMVDGTEGFRLRTIKLRKQISQGLVLPLNILEDNDPIHEGEFSIGISKQPWGDRLQLGPYDDALVIEEGTDVTEHLGIVKWDPPVPAQLAGKVKGNFPSFLKKTDEERIQNLTKEYPEWVKLGPVFYAAEKLDGSSATYYFRDGVFGACSRNLELKAPDEEFVEKVVVGDDGIERKTQENSFWKVARELELKEKLTELGMNISIQGELIGEGIQGNPYRIKGQTVRFFNIFDIDKYEYYDFVDFIDTLQKLGLEAVPMEDIKFQLPESIDELIIFADGKSALEKQANREGLVIRSHDRKISFKVISNRHLLKNER